MNRKARKDGTAPSAFQIFESIPCIQSAQPRRSGRAVREGGRKLQSRETNSRVRNCGSRVERWFAFPRASSARSEPHDHQPTLWRMFHKFSVRNQMNIPALFPLGDELALLATRAKERREHAFSFPRAARGRSSRRRRGFTRKCPGWSSWASCACS